MISRLYKERDCFYFIQRLFGIINMLEDLEEQLEQGKEWSTDTLMYLHFDTDQLPLKAVLDDPDARAMFLDIYPTQAHLLTEAESVCAVLDELHTVRQNLLEPHLRPDGKDIVQDKLEDDHVANLRERGIIRGLTEAQQQAYEAQLSPRGHYVLGATEKTALKAAISQKMAEPKRPDAVKVFRQAKAEAREAAKAAKSKKQ